MRTFFLRAFLLLVGLCMMSLSGSAQTDLGLSLYGAFSGRTTGNGTVESPANSAGGIIELRHISNPLVGYEATYSYNRANQTYSRPAGTATCAIGVPCTPETVRANAHEITADWLVSVHVANLRPFVLGGAGLLLNQPDSSQTNTSTSTKGVFVYGAGLDWGVFPHLGLRFQYRGNLYKAPDLTKLYTSTDRFTHTAQPMIGAYFRF
ncbi:outer membrane beta-barrel protein [Occallatibacter savannae]|uniref:outer membrane beta-barrel protein n=1 Tax=Occallatibacter savannae TaxID=1002691 RepID=UPI0013A5901F|nr:outer membrane beta-barrel protein [Occallatibacter savannae]